MHLNRALLLTALYLGGLALTGACCSHTWSNQTDHCDGLSSVIADVIESYCEWSPEYFMQLSNVIVNITDAILQSPALSSNAPCCEYARALRDHYSGHHADAAIRMCHAYAADSNAFALFIAACADTVSPASTCEAMLSAALKSDRRPAMAYLLNIYDLRNSRYTNVVLRTRAVLECAPAFHAMRFQLVDAYIALGMSHMALSNILYLTSTKWNALECAEITGLLAYVVSNYSLSAAMFENVIEESGKWQQRFLPQYYSSLIALKRFGTARGLLKKIVTNGPDGFESVDDYAFVLNRLGFDPEKSSGMRKYRHSESNAFNAKRAE